MMTLNGVLTSRFGVPASRSYVPLLSNSHHPSLLRAFTVIRIDTLFSTSRRLGRAKDYVGDMTCER
jgi:hypothetical protein